LKIIFIYLVVEVNIYKFDKFFLFLLKEVMSNPFSVLHNEEPEETTDNPQRKLKKMKRRFAEKPTPELEKKIKEMESRLNPKKHNSKNKNSKNKNSKNKNSKNKNSKNKKKKEDDIDLETEYQKNKAYWEEYWKEEYQKQKQKKESRREYENTSLDIDEEIRAKLPQDIKDFIDDPADKKTYHKLSKIYHPDKGGDTELFKIISNHMYP